MVVMTFLRGPLCLRGPLPVHPLACLHLVSYCMSPIIFIPAFLQGQESRDSNSSGPHAILLSYPKGSVRPLDIYLVLTCACPLEGPFWIPDQFCGLWCPVALRPPLAVLGSSDSRRTRAWSMVFHQASGCCWRSAVRALRQGGWKQTCQLQSLSKAASIHLRETICPSSPGSHSSFIHSFKL